MFDWKNKQKTKTRLKKPNKLAKNIGNTNDRKIISKMDKENFMLHKKKMKPP